MESISPTLQTAQVVSIGCGFSRNFMVESQEPRKSKSNNKRNTKKKGLSSASSTSGASTSSHNKRSLDSLVEAGKFHEIVKFLKTAEKETIRFWLLHKASSFDDDDDEKDRLDASVSSTMYASDLSSAGYMSYCVDETQQSNSSPQQTSTALHTIFKGSRGSPPVEVVDLIIAHLRELHYIFVPEAAIDDKGRTPLHIAASRNANHESLLRLLKGEDASEWPATQCDFGGRTPLHWAASAYSPGQGFFRRRQKDATNGFRNMQALVAAFSHARYIKDNDGKTPLDLLPDDADPQVVRLLKTSSRRRRFYDQPEAPCESDEDVEVPRDLRARGQSVSTLGNGSRDQPKDIVDDDNDSISSHSMYLCEASATPRQFEV